MVSHNAPAAMARELWSARQSMCAHHIVFHGFLVESGQLYFHSLI